MNKTDLRKIYLEKRKNLSPAQRAEKSTFVAERFFERFDLTEIKFLHCFVPIEKFGEIDTSLIFDRMRREFPRVATLAPRADFTSGEMESVRLDSMSALVRSKFGIDEPANDAAFEPESIDVVLTPLLCFDNRGFRVGYGKGFYDKFLRKCRADCLKIGLSFFEPIEKVIDTNDFDVKLDFCVTPENVYEFGA
jgi:5-formyltetrahydrofolate cyclo-ligase